MASRRPSRSASWDAHYQARPAPTEPSDLFIELSEILPVQGQALDLVCGGERNSVYLAQRGLRVIAVDRSHEALQQGRELARRTKVQVNWVEADLEHFPLPADTYDLVTVFYYRHPSLYPRFGETLRVGGLLLYETYTAEQLRFESGPRNRAHLLDPGELLKVFGHWKVILYRESSIGRAVTSLVARKGGG